MLTPNLETSHPFSLKLPLQDAAHLVPSLAGSGTTADPSGAGAVKLINGTVECSSCHNPHNQFGDLKNTNFLVRSNENGGLCLSCHTTAARTVGSRNNPLEPWATSIHAVSSAQIGANAGLGGYSTVAELACGTCHATHGAAPGGGLLRNPKPPVQGMDGVSQACLGCHDGGNKLLSPILNVYADLAKPRAHPFASASNKHALGEPTVLNNNRHATCADCHNAHAAKQTVSFNAAPGIRPSQLGVAGVDANGALMTTPAANQYENCLRCHGSSAGKQSGAYGYTRAVTSNAGDPLNVLAEFDATALSAHPVMRAATLTQQPSLLPFMWNLTATMQSRPMGTQIFCTDCHNSDNNREFGGTGANGPHGSSNDHLLERRYVMSQVAAPTGAPGTGPGSPIINATPNPFLTGSASPFALCAKCHNLENIAANVSFAEHSRHMQKNGFSCSTCHSAHGVPAGTAGVSGTRLVSFDINVVAPNTGSVPTYANGTCNLICHGKAH